MWLRLTGPSDHMIHRCDVSQRIRLIEKLKTTRLDAPAHDPALDLVRQLMTLNGIGPLTAECLSGLPQCGFQHSEIAQSVGAPGFCDDETVKLEDLRQTEVAGHPRRS